MQKFIRNRAGSHCIELSIRKSLTLQDVPDSVSYVAIKLRQQMVISFNFPECFNDLQYNFITLERLPPCEGFHTQRTIRLSLLAQMLIDAEFTKYMGTRSN